MCVVFYHHLRRTLVILCDLLHSVSRFAVHLQQTLFPNIDGAYSVPFGDLGSAQLEILEDTLQKLFFVITGFVCNTQSVTTLIVLM